MHVMHTSSKRLPAMEVSSGCVFQQRLTPIPTLSLTGTQRQLPPRSRREGRPPTRDLPRLPSSEVLFSKTVGSRQLPSRGGFDLATLVISNEHRNTTAVAFDPPMATVRRAPRLVPLNRASPPTPSPHQTKQSCQPPTQQIARSSETFPTSFFRRNSSPLAPFCNDSVCASPIGAAYRHRAASITATDPLTKVDNLLLSGASLTCPPAYGNIVADDVVERLQGSPMHAFYKNSKAPGSPVLSVFDASPSMIRDDGVLPEIDEVLRWSDRAAARTLAL
ncbi:Hypothetical protein, putative [Bodo saltans]|uniref:Uncharacterized protein n=1 Tax=Bodo saltans TaxID=75058 RepID=A0A0S4J4S4_BODSA|nr:Hypothetical protein, putative [Bodo saltans]|eukprot:CUG83825.1 Hypothetical protein, putative [Bodo saltans]